MKYIAFFLTLITHCSLSVAQLNIDSLQVVLKTEKTDSVTLSSYLDLMNKLSTSDMDASLTIGNWVAEKSLSNKIYSFHVKAYLGVAGLYHNTDDFENAVKYYTKTQEAADKFGQYELGLETLSNLANVYYKNNQFDKAEEIYKKTIAECQKSGITIGVGVGYGSLGTLYFSGSGNDMGKKRKAIQYMMMAVELFESIKDTAQIIPAFSSLCKMYSSMKLFDSAIYFIDKAGRLLAAKKDNEESYIYYYYHRGTALFGQGKHKEAIENFLTGLPFTKKFKAPLWESSHYEGLSNAYKAMGDYKKALEYGERHFKIEDSVINAENFAKAADIQNKYEREKKDKEILKLNKDKEIAANKRKELNTYLLLTLSGLAILGFLLFSLLRNIKARKKAYAELEKRNEEIKEQALQLSRQARLIAKFQSQMNPHFTFNALHNIYGLVIGHENEKAITQIQSLAGLMRQTLTNSVKEEITLEEEINYLQKYIDFEKATSLVNFDFKIEVGSGLEDAVIPPMMIQPFIENAVKHAELDKAVNPFVKVLIEKENNLLKLVIEDNGRGINKEAGNINKLSHSVSIIKSRIEMLFQNTNKELFEYFSIDTVAGTGKGTVVKFYLPLNFSH